jgi:hypothetical protein
MVLTVTDDVLLTPLLLLLLLLLPPATPVFFCRIDGNEFAVIIVKTHTVWVKGYC